MFEHRVTEETSVVKRSEMWTATVNGYEVYVSRDDARSGGTELSIYRGRREGGIHLGILSCRPKGVGDLEAFAADAGGLFVEIARGLRALGMDDLRGDLERQHDKFTASLEAQLRGPAAPAR